MDGAAPCGDTLCQLALAPTHIHLFPPPLPITYDASLCDLAHFVSAADGFASTMGLLAGNPSSVTAQHFATAQHASLPQQVADCNVTALLSKFESIPAAVTWHLFIPVSACLEQCANALLVTA